jgi:hypothetical protein
MQREYGETLISRSAAMKRTSIALVVSMLGATCVQAQTAQQPASSAQAVQQACHSEMQSLCSGKTGHDAMSCLSSNTDKVSPDCKTALQNAQASHKHKKSAY